MAEESAIGLLAVVETDCSLLCARSTRECGHGFGEIVLIILRYMRLNACPMFRKWKATAVAHHDLNSRR
jgi:hypothetical protein